MNEPRRLRDDPAFRELTGGALDDERLALGPYDLDGLRERVVAGQAVPAPAPRWPTLVGVSGLTAALVTIALWATLPVSPALHPPRPTLAPPELRVGEIRSVERVVVPGLGSPSPDGAVEPREAVVDTPDQPVLPEPSVTPAAVAPVAVAPTPAPVVASPVEPQPAGNVPSGPSGLKAELADYNRALDAAEAGRWSEARERYLAYLETWDQGRLRTEATLGLLGALVRSERPAEAEALAERLLDDPRYSRRRDDIRLLRAEALVELDLCDEALGSLEGLRRSPRERAVRSTCRRQRR